MKPLTRILVLIALCCTPIGAWPQAVPGSVNEHRLLKVLFLGNSYTYFNNMPAIVEAFSAASNVLPRIEAHSDTEGGASLESLWQQSHAKRAINGTNWDLVVLQEQSSRPIEASDRMLRFGRYFNDEITRVKAKTLLFVTWPPRRNQKAQRWIDAAYDKLAAKTGATVVPVGTAWQLALKTDPNIQLYDADEHHPSLLGSYVAACTFFLVITESKEPCPALTLPGVRNESTAVGRNAALRAVVEKSNRAKE